jgi:hypothetical protein
MTAHHNRAGRRMLRATAKTLAARWLSGGLFGTLEAALATGARPVPAPALRSAPTGAVGSPAVVHARSG